MDNYISCPIILTLEEHDRFVKRFKAFHVVKEESKMCQLSVFKCNRTQESLKNKAMKKSVLTYQFENSIVQIKYPQYSFMAFGDKDISKQFAFNAEFSFVENSFSKIIKSAQIFSKMVAEQKIYIEIQLYRIKDFILFQFYRLEVSDKVLLIVKDLNSSLLSPKNAQQFEIPEMRIKQSFRQIYDTILCQKNVHHSTEPVLDAETFVQKFKLCKHIYRRIIQNKQDIQKFIDKDFVNTWMINHVAILEFLLSSL